MMPFWLAHLSALAALAWPNNPPVFNFSLELLSRSDLDWIIELRSLPVLGANRLKIWPLTPQFCGLVHLKSMCFVVLRVIASCAFLALSEATVSRLWVTIKLFQLKSSLALKIGFHILTRKSKQHFGLRLHPRFRRPPA